MEGSAAHKSQKRVVACLGFEPSGPQAVTASRPSVTILVRSL